MTSIDESPTDWNSISEMIGRMSFDNNNNSSSRMHSDFIDEIKCIVQCTLQFAIFSYSLDNTLVYPYVTIHEQYFIGNDY